MARFENIKLQNDFQIVIKIEDKLFLKYIIFFIILTKMSSKEV